jgi:hypothetical protein
MLQIFGGPLLAPSSIAAPDVALLLRLSVACTGGVPLANVILTLMAAGVSEFTSLGSADAANTNAGDCSLLSTSRRASGLGFGEAYSRSAIGTSWQPNQGRRELSGTVTVVNVTLVVALDGFCNGAGRVNASVSVADLITRLWGASSSGSDFATLSPALTAALASFEGAAAGQGSNGTIFVRGSGEPLLTVAFATPTAASSSANAASSSLNTSMIVGTIVGATLLFATLVALLLLSVARRWRKRWRREAHTSGLVKTASGTTEFSVINPTAVRKSVGGYIVRGKSSGENLQGAQPCVSPQRGHSSARALFTERQRGGNDAGNDDCGAIEGQQILQGPVPRSSAERSSLVASSRELYLQSAPLTSRAGSASIFSHPRAVRRSNQAAEHVVFSENPLLSRGTSNSDAAPQLAPKFKLTQPEIRVNHAV